MGERRAVSADHAFGRYSHLWASIATESGWSSPAWMQANLACNTASAASVRAILATPTAATASNSACAAA